MKSGKSLFALLVFFTFTAIFACGTDSTAQELKPFIGKWQGMTYGSGAYDPMFTCVIRANGTWTDLTFGENRAIQAKYSFDRKTRTLTLFTAKGSKLYSFKLEAATKEHKERLVEQLPANETYRAMICYHKD